jgi:hypothetical protein
MKRKVTLVFHDEGLYTRLRIEAIRRRATVSAIVAEAVREWLESYEDAGLLPVIDSARAEWKDKGGRPWPEAEHELEESIKRREGRTRAKRV